MTDREARLQQIGGEVLAYVCKEENMSRIGNKVIKILEGVNVEIHENLVTVKGPHGTLSRQFSDLVNFVVENGEIVVKRTGDEELEKKTMGLQEHFSKYGEGVHTKFKKN